jgi:hypothetical protein
MRQSGYITRRAFIGAGAVCALSLSGPSFVDNSDIARGRVFEMETGSARGIAGVLVSNGVEVTQTDADGAYELPIRDGVFVIKPAHWNLPFDVNTGAPSFSYMHRPFGSPLPLAHGGLAPTGPLPSMIDFALMRQPEPKAFTAALLADPQPSNGDELNYLRRAMDKMCARRDFAFGIALGDIASDNLSVYRDYQKQAGRLGVPLWHIPGNHDHDSDANDPMFRLETWRATFGPPTYAFEHSGALFIMLDNVTVKPGGYVGEIGPAGLTFVRNLLAFTPPETLVVVCTHIPLISSHAQDPSCITADTKALMALLVGRKSISFSGHMHTSEHHYIPAQSGMHHHQIINALSGAWWSGPFDDEGQPLSVSSDGTPHGWHELSIDGDDYHTTFVPARDEAVVRAMVPGSTNGGVAAATIETVSLLSVESGLLVNVFDGGPRTRVFVEAGGERHLLRRIHAADPYTEQLYREAGASLKYWVQAEASTHLWALDASALSASTLGDARLTIIDEFGRTSIENAPVLLS